MDYLSVLTSEQQPNMVFIQWSYAQVFVIDNEQDVSICEAILLFFLPLPIDSLYV